MLSPFPLGRIAHEAVAFTNQPAQPLPVQFCNSRSLARLNVEMILFQIILQTPLAGAAPVSEAMAANTPSEGKTGGRELAVSESLVAVLISRSCPYWWLVFPRRLDGTS